MGLPCAHCRMLSSICGCFSLDTSNATPSLGNAECLQTLSPVPRGHSQLRTTGFMDRLGLGHRKKISRNNENEDNTTGLLGNTERPLLDLKCKITSYHADIPIQRSMFLETSNSINEKIPCTNMYRFQENYLGL